MNSFSFLRISLLLRKEFIERGRILLYALLGTIGIISIFIFSPVYTQSFSFNKSYLLLYYIVGLFFIGVILANFAFSHFNNAPNTISYLSLPATALEKFFSKFIIYTLLFFVVYTLLFYVLSVLSLEIYKQQFASTNTSYVIYELNKKTKETIKPSLFLFFLIQLFFYYGAIKYKKYSFLITVILALLIIGVFAISTSLQNDILKNVLNNQNIYFKNSGMIIDAERKTIPFEKVYDLPQWIQFLKKIILIYLPVPVLFIITWFTLKEKQVK